MQRWKPVHWAKLRLNENERSCAHLHGLQTLIHWSIFFSWTGFSHYCKNTYILQQTRLSKNYHLQKSRSPNFVPLTLNLIRSDLWARPGYSFDTRSVTWILGNSVQIINRKQFWGFFGEKDIMKSILLAFLESFWDSISHIYHHIRKLKTEAERSKQPETESVSGSYEFDEIFKCCHIGSMCLTHM